MNLFTNRFYVLTAFQSIFVSSHLIASVALTNTFRAPFGILLDICDIELFLLIPCYVSDLVRKSLLHRLLA